MSRVNVNYGSLNEIELQQLGRNLSTLSIDEGSLSTEQHTYLESIRHCLNHLTQCQINPSVSACLKSTLKKLAGPVFLLSGIGLIIYLASLGEEQNNSYPINAPSTSAPLNWTTLFTALTNPTRPTPDPRCEILPDCCDTQGQWICGR